MKETIELKSVWGKVGNIILPFFDCEIPCNVIFIVDEKPNENPCEGIFTGVTRPNPETAYNYDIQVVSGKENLWTPIRNVVGFYNNS